jgi:hypothetical protein
MSKQTESEHQIPALDELRAGFAGVAAADAGAQRSRRMRPFVAALGVLAFAASASVVAVNLGSRDPGEESSASSPREQPAAEQEREGEASTPPAPAGFAAHGIAYQTVLELVRASDLILIGTVDETRVAKEIGEGPEDQFPTRILQTTVAVEELLLGSGSESSVVVATDELAFRGPGIEDWRESGQRVLLFLTGSRDPNEPDVYVPANLAYLQTAYFAVGEELDMTVGGDIEGLSQRIAAMRVPDLRERVRAARP